MFCAVNLPEHGYFSANKENCVGENGTLIDQVVEVVSKCSDEFDEGVQLQVCHSYLPF